MGPKPDDACFGGLGGADDDGDISGALPRMRWDVEYA
jgi:hypothetical protein